MKLLTTLLQNNFIAFGTPPARGLGQSSPPAPPAPPAPSSRCPCTYPQNLGVFNLSVLTSIRGLMYMDAHR